MGHMDIAVDLEKGKNLSDILYQNKISPYIVSSIKQGEKTGMLGPISDEIAKNLYRQKDINSKMIMSLVYPAILFIATGIIIIFLVVYIFPKMMPMFIGMKVKLPITTRIVIWASNFFRNMWWLIILLSISIIFGIIKIRHRLEFILFKIPIINTWYISQKIIRHFSRISSYLSSGIGLDIACLECLNMESSNIFKKSLKNIYQNVYIGISLSESLQKEKIYPEEIHKMIMVGESSGRLADITKKIADLYEQKFVQTTKTISSSIEPISMLFMGSVVGFVALSMITPLYSITEHVH